MMNENDFCGRGRCFGGGRSEHFATGGRGRAECCRGDGSRWDLMEMLERRVANLEAHVTVQPEPPGGDQGA